MAKVLCVRWCFDRGLGSSWCDGSTQWPTHSRTPELQINHLHENPRPGVGLGITILHFRHQNYDARSPQTTSVEYWVVSTYPLPEFNEHSLLKWRELPKCRLEGLWVIINWDNENSCWSPFLGSSHGAEWSTHLSSVDSFKTLMAPAIIQPMRQVLAPFLHAFDLLLSEKWINFKSYLTQCQRGAGVVAQE